MARYLLLFILFFFPLSAEKSMQMRTHLMQAEKGDYIVTARDKNFTLLRISEATPQSISIDEITIPQLKTKKMQDTWRDWFLKGAPNHTSWVTYSIELPSGKIKDMYSHTQQSFCSVPEEDNLFTKLLSLDFQVVSEKERKKKGSSQGPKIPNWNPKMIVDGKVIPNVEFTPWKTDWPNDGTELAGRHILIYLPTDSKKYPSYFPYWMQFSGGLAKVQVRIIDSGKLSY